MGNRLIKAMVLQLEGTYSYVHGEGTVFTAEINVAQATRRDRLRREAQKQLSRIHDIARIQSRISGSALA